MDVDQITLVQKTWKKIAPLPTTATMFYGRLFALDPTIKQLFKGDMAVQRRKLMRMMNIAVNGLTDLEYLIPQIQTLGQRHHAYGVTPDHYNAVGAALLWTLEKNLGDEFTPDVSTAWSETYYLLAEIMKATQRAVIGN